MDQLAKLAFVITQLSMYSGTKKSINSGSTFVSCPYHAESTPSFRIFHSSATKSPGYGKCYGCGTKKPWNEFAPLIGLKAMEYAKPTPLFAAELRKDFGAKDQQAEELEFADLPEGKWWRTISTDFLIEIGAKKCWPWYTNDDGTKFLSSTPYVYLPVNVLNRKRGYIKARLKKKDGAPSYINSKGSWSAECGLFLYDYVVKRFSSKVLVLVEGPRDGLRLCSLGIPAISILGTQSWSDRKSRLIELSGAKHVILCMDGDCSGIKADTTIAEKLKGFVRVHHFDLAGSDSPYHQFRDEDEPTKAAKAAGVTLWDPGCMPLRKVKQLKSLVAQFS